MISNPLSTLIISKNMYCIIIYLVMEFITLPPKINVTNIQIRLVLIAHTMMFTLFLQSIVGL